MPEKHYYLLTMLPSPGPLGSEPPVTMAGLFARLDEDSDAARIVRTIALSDDLLLREAVLAGEVDQPEPAVLSVAQLADEEPLPTDLAEHMRTQGVYRAAADAMWQGYYRYAAAVAAETDSDFLAAWVGFEVALRNELVAARARALDLEASDYTVAEDLAQGHAEIAQAVSQWASAPNPLEAQRALDRARMAWLGATEPYYTFQDDEIAAYAAKVQLLLRWQRIGRAEQDTQAPDQPRPS
jgi:hypothetical protein